MKIGDRIYVRGYIDEIRKDTVIVRNDGGYFGTILSEVTPSAQLEQEEPTVDAVPVIRCKDCKHYVDEQCDRYADETLGYVHSTQADGYCWVAERKEK